jgi:hypothetical protein
VDSSPEERVFKKRKMRLRLCKSTTAEEVFVLREEAIQSGSKGG